MKTIRPVGDRILVKQHKPEDYLWKYWNLYS